MQMFAISATAFGGIAARGWAPFGWRFGNSVEDRIAKISMRDCESAMVGNFDCDMVWAAVPRPGPIKRMITNGQQRMIAQPLSKANLISQNRSFEPIAQADNKE